METYGSVSEEGETQSGMEIDDNPAENDFHFGYLTVETSEPPPLLETCESISENDSLESAVPNFYEIIPSLKEMASIAVAIALWRRIISLKDAGHRADPYAIYEEDEKQVENLLEDLPGPRLIRELVRNYVRPVRKEMNRWLHFYNLNLFTSKRATGDGTRDICDSLFCVWLPDGRIDDRKSALNMLSNPRLSQVDKFKIMCRYCLEDEIKKLSGDSFPSYFTKRIQFSKNALVYYWLCYVKGQLNKLPKNKDQSVESFLITAFNVDTWSAIEYFWNRLNVNEQLSKVEEIIERRPDFQIRLFSKMNEFQKRHILSKIPIQVASNFWSQPGQEHCTLSTWIYIRNFVNYDQFKVLIRNLLRECLSGEQDEIPWLVDIWNNVPDDFKNRIDLVHFIIEIHTNYYDISCHNVEFLLATLSHLSAEKRKIILFEHTDDLVLKMRPSVIDALIKFCLPKPEDVLEFKNHILDSDIIQDYCCQMLHDNDLRRLNTFLDFYCVDSNTRSEFCSKFLNLFAISGCPFYYLPKWIETVEFIDSNLLDRLPNQAIRFKKRLAWSFAGFCCELWSNNVDSQIDMNKMIEVVGQVLDNEEILMFKTRALERVQTRYRWGNFDQSIIDGFLKWCCDNDEQMVREFKKSLSIEGIFDYAFDMMKWNRVLDNDVDEKTVFKIFDPLEKALLWYFENADDVKRFKLAKVFAYCDGGVSMFRKYTQMENNVFTRNTLPWFFDGDREQIDKFKKRFKDEDISEMI